MRLVRQWQRMPAEPRCRKAGSCHQRMVQCSFVAAGYSIVAAIVMILFGNSFALLFVDSTEVEIIRNVAKLLIINSLFFIPLALVNIIRFAIQGLGFGNLAIFAGVAEMVGLKYRRFLDL